MRRTLLVARQEFIKYVTRRGFFISIAMFPLWIVIVMLVPQWTSGADSPVVFTIVDRAGGAYRAAILEAVARGNETRDLNALARYATANRAQPLPAKISAMLANPGVAQSLRVFRRFGGRQAVLDALKPLLKPGAAAFSAPVPRFVYADPPPDLARATPDGAQAALHKLFAREDRAPLDIDAAVVIASDFGPVKPDAVQFWSPNPNAGLRDFVASALTEALRLAVIRHYAPRFADTDALETTAAVQARNPTKTDGRAAMTDSIVPVALAIILFVVSVMNSSVLLQGVVEEKSTRMIEVLLSCATPREITTGKLIGVIGVALTTLVIWGLALLAMTAIASHETVSLVLSSLRAIVTLQTTPLLLLYFLCGLLIYGSLFLAIGSMANSLADAQSLLGPSMLILMLPNLMIAGVMRDPNGPLATTLSWVPVYTPFFMMLRIASHPPVWQLWGTAALAVLTTALMILWTGRVFAKHVLTTERPPALGKLIADLFGRHT